MHCLRLHNDGVKNLYFCFPTVRAMTQAMAIEIVFPLGFCLWVKMDSMMWYCQLVLRFHVFAQKRSALLMLFYLHLIKGFVAAAFHGSLQNHLENIHRLKVIFLRVSCRLRFAGCWMLLNWKQPYLKGDGCRQSFKNIKSYSTNSSKM